MRQPKSSHKVPYDRRVLPQGALIEFIGQGNFVKVCAVDPLSYREVAIVGDAKVGRYELSCQAVRKLENVLRQERAALVRQSKQKSAKRGWLA